MEAGRLRGQALRKLYFRRDNSQISANIAYIIENENLMRNIIWKVERVGWMTAARRNTKDHERQWGLGSGKRDLS